MADFDTRWATNFRLIVCGSRSYRDYDRLAADLDRLLVDQLPAVTIVTGACPSGADALAARYARERGLLLYEMPAQWDKWGKWAGPIRNRQMADYGHACVAYWDGRSRGTADMIRQAQAADLRTVVRKF